MIGRRKQPRTPVPRTRVAAFDAARGVRDGEPAAWDALHTLLAGSPDHLADPGTLLNVLSALRYVVMAPDDVRGGWTPPAAGVGDAIRRGLVGDALTAQQTEDLLWALIDARLLGRWLGPVDAEAVIAAVAPGDLRRALAHAEHVDRLLSRPVSDGAEFPLVA